LLGRLGSRGSIDDREPPRAAGSQPAGLAPRDDVLARNRLAAELLFAELAVEGRSQPTLDDLERAGHLAAAMLARRRHAARRSHSAPVTRR
jgi:hypothetical protein